MNLTYGVKQVMHRIRVKLYPNYLPGYESTFIARTDSEASLAIEQVCVAMSERGGFKGDFGDCVENVKRFLRETAYQLSDGFAVNMEYFGIYPNLGGTFSTEHDKPDPKKNPLTFRFRPLAPLRKLAESIVIVVEGVADPTGYIDEYLDVEEQAVNSIYVPGNQFVLTGHRIKVVGDDPSCGVYFVPKDNPAKKVKLARLAENSQSKIIAVAADTEHQHNRIEIITQSSPSGSGSILKTPRLITSKFTLEAA
ncbi:MAG: DUF4469 domain-containing protein [Treponema sp.]|jgi:hypothetical protein|nr:DUF4469 domain-containing protein [Treponema sp.]